MTRRCGSLGRVHGLRLALVELVALFHSHLPSSTCRSRELAPARNLRPGWRCRSSRPRSPARPRAPRGPCPACCSASTDAPPAMCCRRLLSSAASSAAAASLCRWPKPPADAVLQARADSRSLASMLEIVIAFEHQRVATRQARLDVAASRCRGRSARRAADCPSVITNCTGSRASCGTGNGSTSRSPTANASWLSKPYTCGTPAKRSPTVEQRAEGQPHRNAVAGRERRQRRRRGRLCSCVTTIGVEGLGRDADAGEARRGVAHAESAVDHDARGPRFDDEAVALAAAADRREAHYDLRVTSAGL